jgi:hypothetical protein
MGTSERAQDVLLRHPVFETFRPVLACGGNRFMGDYPSCRQGQHLMANMNLQEFLTPPGCFRIV